ncbi:MAG: PD-(D/E)XK nuclease family protein, partial [Actinomycetota bacterium]|nr:PD-(D/E)XK nuclease family protein [Actinomycetota bacterium]
PLRARLAAARRVRRELPFAVPLGPSLLTGVIDALADEHGGGVLVVDHKTERLGEEADLERHVEEAHGVQRRAYALAALAAGAPRVEVVHAFLARAGATAHATFAPSDAERLRAELRALAAAPLLVDARPTDRPHRTLCATCPGRRALCSHGEEVTLRDAAVVARRRG